MSEIEKIFEQINDARNLERGASSERSELNRNTESYLECLKGLENFLKYIRQNVESKTIVDIGAGSTQAINGISESYLGEGLDFLATGLTKHGNLDEFLGKDKYKITSAEVMRGFKPNSVGGIISVFGGLYYTKSPELVVKTIDKILADGGAVKANFYVPEDAPTDSEEYQRYEMFKKLFKDRGYDIADRLYKFGDHPELDTNSFTKILLAIKQSKNITPAVSAEELLNSDFKNAEEQKEKIKTNTQLKKNN